MPSWALHYYFSGSTIIRVLKFCLQFENKPKFIELRGGVGWFFDMRFWLAKAEKRKLANASVDSTNVCSRLISLIRGR